jgi:hypothetical protein
LDDQSDEVQMWGEAIREHPWPGLVSR